MSKKLTLKDRFYLSMYTRRLPCTLQLRCAVDGFFKQIEITPEEFKNHKIKIVPGTMDFECSDEEYTVEYDEFPQPVLDAMQGYINATDIEKNKDNELVKKTNDCFRKIL